jgi:AcrR family transcriptional regulator
MPKVTEKHREAKREIILHAAIACFARDGFHKTKMSDIADMAGVSDGLAYRYFSGKEEIIQEAVQLVTGSREPVDLETLDDDDVQAMIDLVHRSEFQRFALPERKTTVGLRMQSWSEALENEEVRDQVVGRWARYEPVTVQMWSKARSTGLISEAVDPEAVSQVMMAIHDGLDLRWALDKDIDVEAWGEVVRALLNGQFWTGEANGLSDT